MKAIIPTGGRGTRMQPLTFSSNKHFIPVGNKPLIFYPIEAVAKAGIKEILITYNPGWLDTIKGYLGTGSRWGVKFTYVLQEKPLGLANIFQVCETALKGESFVLHLGDNIFTEGIKELVEYFEKEKPNGLVAKIKHPENWRLGVPIFDKNGRLKDYIEKPKDPPNPFAIPGIYFFDKNVFNCFRGKNKILPSTRGELEILEPYKWLIKNGFRVDVLEYNGKWLDPGKFDDWIKANQYLLDNNLDAKIESKIGKSNRIEGRVAIGKNCKIRGSEIRGPVSIADNVEIVSSYIGPFTAISDDCVIDNSRIENTILMKGVTVSGVGKPIDGSLIGTNTEVIGTNGPRESIELFIGEKSSVKI